MSKQMKINEREVNLPDKEEMTAKEIKEEADIPPNKELYDPSTGETLDDEEEVSPEKTEQLGVVEGWELG